MKSRIPSLSVKEGTRKFTMAPIENYLHLQAMVSIRLRNRNLGAYLLKKNKSSPWQLVFGFACEGIHSFLSAEEIRLLAKIQDGLNLGKVSSKL